MNLSLQPSIAVTIIYNYRVKHLRGGGVSSYKAKQFYDETESYAESLLLVEV